MFVGLRGFGMELTVGAFGIEAPALLGPGAWFIHISCHKIRV